MKRILYTTIVIIIVFMLPLSVIGMESYKTESTYESYIYGTNDEPIRTPDYYMPTRTITGIELGLSDLSDLNDLFYDGQNRIYLVDSIKNRVLVLDKEYHLLKTIDSFLFNGETQQLSKPTCVTVNNEDIFIGDTGSERILVFDKVTYQLKRVVVKPVIDILSDKGYSFLPEKMVVDYANRLYILVKDVNRGVLILDVNGKFSSFIGAPKVTVKLTDLFWRKISTKKQKAAMVKFIPTEYSAIDIDADGFLYVTAKTANVSPISKLNTQGTNVLKVAKGIENPNGDGRYRDGGSLIKTGFSGIAVKDNGSYLTVDSALGRIYLYDGNGNLLSAFGGKGSQTGNFYSPNAIEVVDSKILVIDKINATLTEFILTDFGKSVDLAMLQYNKGDYDNAYESWKKVLASCSNYYPAVIGVAHIEIQKGHFQIAKQMLEDVGEQQYYAIAFQDARSLFIRKNFTFLFLTFLLLVVLIYLGFKYWKKLPFVIWMRSKKLYKQLHYSLYTMFHPFDGFWDLKREKRGSAKAASVLYTLFMFVYLLRTQYSGYTYIEAESTRPGILYSCFQIALPLVLWVISNWCFSTLMDGDGNMKDIYIFTGYSLAPYIITGIPLFLLSHVLTAQEAAFYTVFDSAVIVWVGLLLFFGMMTTHDYSFTKSILTAILSIVGICIIIFIGLLFINLIQEIMVTFLGVYKELSFRAS